MRIACLQNPVGSVKDALGGALSKALALSPGLNVTSRKSRTLQTQRFAAKQRHGFGFHLADVAGRHFGIGQVGFIAMTEQLVGLCSAEHKRTYVTGKFMLWRRPSAAKGAWEVLTDIT